MNTLIHRSRLYSQLLGLTALCCAQTATSRAAVTLAITNSAAVVEISWNSDSLTTTSPFLHYDFQVETSSDLSNWTNFGANLPGGVNAARSFSRKVEIPKGGAIGFYRLAYQLKLPGADLHGLDLSGADLRNAELTGANLANANLAGADLSDAIITGVQLSGANLTGAIIAGVDLDGLDLDNVNLSAIQGTPFLSRVTADPTADARELLPALPYSPANRELAVNEPGMPDHFFSTKNAFVMLKPDVTVGDLNALLIKYSASIVGSISRENALTNGTLMLRFPTKTAAELLRLTSSLKKEPQVMLAAPDIKMRFDNMTADSKAATAANPAPCFGTSAAPTGAWNWQWNAPGHPDGGNWGLERARVPQIWSWYDAINKQGSGNIPTGVIDGGFPNHPDIFFSLVLGTTNMMAPDHGLHVSGTIGANWGNNDGIDGVNPFATLAGCSAADSPFGILECLGQLYYNVANLQIVNLSMGTDLPNPVSPIWLELIKASVAEHGIAFGLLAITRPSVLIVCSAGNDFSQITADYGSEACYAAKGYGANNIIIVGSHGTGGTHSSFSNLGADVEAPGEFILSAITNGSYDAWCGTSMAAPFVSGLAGYLRAIDPALTVTELKTLLMSSGIIVDAFNSVMEIDNLDGRDRKALKMLLDIDDGFIDGNSRVLPFAPTLPIDRSFDPILGLDFTGEDNDHDGGMGNGKIDMADFRRWRDWILLSEGNHKLNGNLTNTKNDFNWDGVIDAREATHYPRGDFNGDGRMNRTNKNLMFGYLKGTFRTDLEVLMESGLWKDDCYTNPKVLTNLIDSVDFTIFATNFYYKHSDVPTEAKLAVYSTDTHTPIEEFLFNRIPIAETNSTRVITVPTGGKYYVASDYISIGGETNVIMRSIGDIDVPQSERGADYVVDLALVEMTAVAELQNPGAKQVDSKPDKEIVEAHFGAPILELEDTTGVEAWSNDQGTFYSLARAGNITGYAPTNSSLPTVYTASVRWQRSFTNSPSARPFQFVVTPMILRLIGSGPAGAEQRAYAEIFVEMRAYDVNPGWQPIFSWRAEIAGTSGSGAIPTDFRLEREEGTGGWQPIPLTRLGNAGAQYVQKKFSGEFPMGGIKDGHSFEVRYSVVSRVTAWGNGDNVAEAYIGDPLHYGTGFRISYGGFGDLPRISEYSTDGTGVGHVSFLSRTNFYYLLYRGTNVEASDRPIAVKLGTAGLNELLDHAPLVGAGKDSYTLENQPIDQPLDLDGDGMDDVYELKHATILDPLDPSDALKDPDADGFSNFAEYTNGTEPLTSDAPANPVLRFPGIIVPSYPGGEPIDLNNDGVWDLASAAGNSLFGSLGTLGGVFQAQVESEVPDARSLSDVVFVKLDSDSFPDAMTIDLLASQLTVLRGLGDGHFVQITNYPTATDSRQIVLGNLNGDGVTDVAVMSGRGRGADLFLGAGNGLLTKLTTVSTDLFGLAHSLALADLNSDQRDDLIVTYNDEAVVFLSQPNGSYGTAHPYTTGVSPDSIAIGDLNKDGHPDLVTANRSTDDLSVLLGIAGGAFLPETRYPVGDLPLGLQLLDLNGDTALDIIVSRPNSDYQTVFLNSGTGLLSAPYIVPIGNGESARLIDWNGDGKIDLISGIDEGGLVNLGNGNGTFASRSQIAVENPLTQVRPVDLNGDGRLEIVGLNTVSNSVDIWQHAAVAGTNRLLGRLTAVPYISAFSSGDFNRDGKPDLAVATQTNSLPVRGTNQLLVFVNQGNITFTNVTRLPLDLATATLLSGDFDANGTADLAAISTGGFLGGGARLATLLGDGMGAFQLRPSTGVGTVLYFADVTDFDGDLRSDIVLQGSRLIDSVLSSFLEVYAFDLTAGWTQRQSLVVSNDLSSLQIVKMNGDAYPDLVALETDPSGRATLVLFPGGPGGLGPRQVFADNVDFQVFSHLADLNNDGRIDVISFNTLFLAKPSGGFHPGQKIWIGFSGVEDVADFNLDGKPDLMSGPSILLQE